MPVTLVALLECFNLCNDLGFAIKDGVSFQYRMILIKYQDTAQSWSIYRRCADNFYLLFLNADCIRFFLCIEL